MTVVCRKISKINDDIFSPDPSTNILVLDSGADQSLINSAWTISHRTGRFIYLMGPLAGRSKGSKFEIVTASAVLIDETGKRFYATINEALYDPSPHQNECLLSKHQCLRLYQNGIDDCSRLEHDIFGRPGMQTAKFGSELLPFYLMGSSASLKLKRLILKLSNNTPMLYSQVPRFMNQCFV